MATNINTGLLIASPTLQDYLVDNATGLPMSAGIVTCYSDNSRTTYKNWYYQSGIPGAYTYIPLSNPLTLSAVGTISDPNGNDTIPFFYPYLNDNVTPDPYYITVYNSNGQQQFVRQNFPFNVLTETVIEEASLNNYIINNTFWRNIGSMNVGTLANSILINGNPLYYATLAPSQHDGFSMPDLNYMKNVNGATETVTFTKFAPGEQAIIQAQPGINDIVPEYYINHNCNAATTGETQKFYQFPISLHIQNLDSVQFTTTILANVPSGSAQINLYVYQFLGTGVTSPAPVLITETAIQLTTEWQKFTNTFIFPNSLLVGANVSQGGDDAFYLQIGMPLNVTFQVNFTKPSLYLSNIVPTNDYATYDEIDTVINSPRTGDTRISMNAFQPYGWIPATVGTICNVVTSPTPAPVAPAGTRVIRSAQDTFQLFTLLWNHYKANSMTSTFPYVIYNNDGTVGTYGANAYLDFVAFKQIIVASGQGYAIGGSSTLPDTYIVANTNANTLALTETVSYVSKIFPGEQFYLTTTGTLPSGLTTGVVYYVCHLIGFGITVSSSYQNAIAGTTITFGTSYTGTITMISNVAGMQVGEYTHKQLGPEVGPHTHTLSNHGAILTDQTTGSPTVAGDSGGPYQTTSIAINTPNSTTSTSNRFNVVQPTIFYNVFMKL